MTLPLFRNQTDTAAASTVWHPAVEFSRPGSQSSSRQQSHSISQSCSKAISNRSSFTYAPQDETTQNQHRESPPPLHYCSSYVPSAPVPALIDGHQRRHSADLVSHPHPYEPLPTPSIPLQNSTHISHPVNHSLDPTASRARALSTSAALPFFSCNSSRNNPVFKTDGGRKWFYGPAPNSFGGPECPLTKTLSNPRTRLEREISRDERDVQMYGGDAIRDPPLRSPDSLIRETVSEYHSEDGTAISEHRLESEARDVAADATADTNLVGWDGPDDPENPQNWSVKYKWIVTGICILMTVNVYVSISPFLHVVNDGVVSRTFASSAPSMATPNIIQEFGITREVSDLTTTMFLLGYVFGVCTSPLSIIHFTYPPTSHCSGDQVPKSQAADLFSHLRSPCIPSSTLAKV